MALIDQWLETFHYSERHSIEIRAQCGDAYRALKTIDLADSRLIQFLFALRGVPLTAPETGGTAALPMADFLGRFTELAVRPGEALVVGAVGRFWLPAGGAVAVDADSFRAYQAPGVAKLAMSFSTEPGAPGRCRLRTETRVWCTDARARRRFRIYWYLIRPASGLIRREMLRLTKRRAEAGLARA